MGGMTPLLLLLLPLLSLVVGVVSSSTASWRRAVDCGPRFSVPPKLTFLFFGVGEDMEFCVWTVRRWGFPRHGLRLCALSTHHSKSMATVGLAPGPYPGCPPEACSAASARVRRERSSPCWHGIAFETRDVTESRRGVDGHTHQTPIIDVLYTSPSDAHTYLVVEPLRLHVPRHVNQRPLEPRVGELLLLLLSRLLLLLLSRLLLSRLLWLLHCLRSRWGLRLPVLLQRGGGPRLEAGGSARRFSLVGTASEAAAEAGRGRLAGSGCGAM